MVIGWSWDFHHDPKGCWTPKQTQWNNEKNVWISPTTLVAKGNPRFPSAAYAKDGSLWIAYCVDNQDRREVAVLVSGE